MNVKQHARLRAVSKCISVAAIAVGGWLVAPNAFAVDPNGPTVQGDICMQKVFGTPVTNANKLNCTANDIRLSKAKSVSPSSCIRGGPRFDLTATFEVIVTANARYDAGFFFRTDGGANARGGGTSGSETCSLSGLTPPPPANGPVLDLDAGNQSKGDSCGDLNAGTYEVTFVIPDVECKAAEGTNNLALPNCTSWHSNQGTVCDISNPFSTTDAFDFKPDTKSKCVCDDTFTVPVLVEDATIEVIKDADPPTVPEPAGTVSFTVKIKNLATVEAITVTSIEDDVFGDLGATPSQYDPNNCPSLIGDEIGPGEQVSCSFSARVEGESGDEHKDTVTVYASQPSNPQNELFGSDDAIVTFSDVYKLPTVSKTAQSTANCSVDATYQVVVSNNDASNNPSVDSLEINSLIDNKFGDITSVHAAGGEVEEVVSTTCNQAGNLFDTIVPGGSYTCSFVGRIHSSSSSCAIDHTNEVTASVTDDDGTTSTPSDDALVTVTASPE